MRIIGLVTLGLLIVACGLEPGGAGSTTTTPSTTTSIPDTTTTPEPHDSRVDKAIADLADRLDIDPEQIEVVSNEDVTWNDGSIGCPDPGMSYTQALVDGYLIVLSVDDVEHHYHGAGQNDPFLCEGPSLDR